MARMSIDDGLGRDPRLDHLAELCGWTRRETAGCLQLDIWPLCYDRVTPNIPARDLNVAANRGASSPITYAGGFAAALIEAGLARPSTRADASFEWVRKGQPTLLLWWKDREWKERVYIKGASERIAYLIKSEESGRIGGRNSGQSRANNTKGPFGHPSRDPQGSGNPSSTLTATASSPSSSSVPASDPEEDSAALSAGGTRLELFQAKVDSAVGDLGQRRARKSKPSEPTPDEQASATRVLSKLSARNGVRYTGTGEHVRLIVAQLRNGVTEADLRKVIGYCAIELEWADDAKQAAYLRPETLFGPKTIHRYLDPARTWFEKQGLSLDDVPQEVAS